MLGKIKEFINGRRTVTIAKGDLCAAFDLIYRSGLRFHGERRTADGAVRITMSERDSRSFARLADARDLPYKMSPPHGLPVVAEYLRRRPMIAVGLVAMFVWLFISERMVWDIRVSGNTKTPSSEIIAQLDELGFGVGTFYKSVNFNRLHADYAAAQEDIAWLSIYMDGAVAEVEVREKWKDTREKHGENTYANVVAESAGVVQSVNVFEGQAAVEIGDIVVPGQVLISGVVEMKEENQARYEYAAGEVICTVAEPIDISAPIKRVEKRFTGTEKAQKSVKIFKKTVNLFINGGKDMPSCDKIDTVDQVNLFGVCPLPVWVNTTTYREYADVEVTVSAEEVANEVVSALSDKMKALSATGSLTSKQLEAKFENGVYSVKGVVYLERDIGKTSEFTAVP
ncbi:MAG: sporulation protein YqfD [Eubacteriales bacterium]